MQNSCTSPNYMDHVYLALESICPVDARINFSKFFLIQIFVEVMD